MGISNQSITKSIENLWNVGVNQISKENGNNIFDLWRRTFDEADCGFYYVIDESQEASAEFQTEVAPLSDEGWYYYLAEYNEWRVEQTRE